MPQKCPVWCKKALKNSKIRSTLRVRIEGNIENGNCYCIRIDYDDNNEEKEEEEDGYGWVDLFSSGELDDNDNSYHYEDEVKLKECLNKKGCLTIRVDVTILTALLPVGAAQD